MLYRLRSGSWYFVTQCSSSLLLRCTTVGLWLLLLLSRRPYSATMTTLTIPASQQLCSQCLGISVLSMGSGPWVNTWLCSTKVRSAPWMCCACHFFIKCTKSIPWLGQGILRMIYVAVFPYCLFNTKQSFSTKFSGAGICSEKLTQKSFYYLREDGVITGFAVIQCLCERMRDRQQDTVV